MAILRTALWGPGCAALLWVACCGSVRAEGLCGDMLRIPAGAFRMGDALGVGGHDEKPLHVPRLSAFWMDRCETSNDEMREVLQWAYAQDWLRVATNGFFNTQGLSRELIDSDDWNAELHFKDGVFSVTPGRERFPCIEVTWFGALAFANFRSLKEGFEPCVNFEDWSCNFSRNGYRLPTEAEWEKAARGGLVGHPFPWNSSGGKYWDHVQGRHANFWGSGDAFEQAEGYTLSTPVGYYDGSQSPAGPAMTNAYGLLDMTGNVEEWCWDVYSRAAYKKRAAQGVNPAGPSEGKTRVVRGGSWITGQKEEWASKSLEAQRYHLRIADRTWRDPGRGQHFRGFRCVRR